MIEQAKAWVRAQYWSRRDHRSTSAGTKDAGLPVVLDSVGQLAINLMAKLLATANTWTAAQTFSVAPKVPGGLNAEAFALDSSGSAFVLTNTQSLPISASGAFAGLIIAINSITGTTGMYLCSGGSVNLVSSTGGVWGTASGGSANNVFHSASKYWLENNTGASVTYYLMGLRVRDLG